ncbi:MAG: type II toxin-antitoxin system VapC family toxin [Deltaproteobacteria bacterium]|nr:type II toxin-antitoxin system VapC family toxin [Deltaproteobacteria bacterium]
MRILLDTHCWLWLLAEPNRFAPAVLTDLRNPAHDLLLSSASSWEMTIKFDLGKLQLPFAPRDFIPSRMQASGVAPLAITHEHALAVGKLPNVHRDPFDRMLIAQAKVEDLVILTADRVFSNYDVGLLRPN